jgi:integrase
MVRPSETRALHWEDLDFKHGLVTIRRHYSLNEVRRATKGKNIKRIPFGSDLAEVLSRLPRHITCPLVFQKNGKPYSESYARKLWNRISSEMGIHISFYKGTRHSSATEAVNRVGPDVTQKFLNQGDPGSGR